LIQLSYQRGIPVFGQFASLQEQELACQALDTFYGRSWQEGVQASFYGGYPDAERRVVCFLPEQGGFAQDSVDFPICCVRIAPANKRFCEALNHRDYLGCVMNLGITRDQIGDILVQQDKTGGSAVSTAYLFCKRDKAALITDITRIRHTTVTAGEISFEESGWEPSFREITGSVSSFRLDAILSLALKTSRAQSLALIQSGAVALNGRCCTENAKKLEAGDIFSAKGYGKFLFEQTTSLSKKGRYHITVKQYI
jgi:RNA-binding protein YlmH